MIRWLLLIPFALLLAVGASSLFFMFAAMVDPVMAMLTGETLFVGFWSLMDAVFASDDPGPIVADALQAVGRIVFTFLVFPPLIVAALGEILRMRSLVWHVGATAVLTAAVPWILRGQARITTPAELHVSLVLALTGAVAGFVYWAVAGREAGRKGEPQEIEPG